MVESLIPIVKSQLRCIGKRRRAKPILFTQLNSLIVCVNFHWRRIIFFIYLWNDFAHFNTKLIQYNINLATKFSPLAAEFRLTLCICKYFTVGNPVMWSLVHNRLFINRFCRISISHLVRCYLYGVFNRHAYKQIADRWIVGRISLHRLKIFLGPTIYIHMYMDFGF